MKEDQIIFKPIGTILSPHTDQNQTPIQPVYAQGIEGRIVVNAEFIDGLKDLQAFSHIYIFYHFNQSVKTKLLLKPFLEDKIHGVFATRAPHRPNKLGMSLVRLVRIEENIIYVKDLDVLDKTPLIDIKPYVKRFDSRDNVSSGWQDDVREEDAKKRGSGNFKL